MGLGDETDPIADLNRRMHLIERRQARVILDMKEHKKITEQAVTDIQQVVTDLHENTVTTRRIDTNTAQLIIAFDSARGAWNVLEFMGKAAKPVFWISVFATGIVALGDYLWVLLNKPMSQLIPFLFHH